jgi:hypothetical protein
MPPRISGVKENVIRQLEENFETDRYGVDTITLKVEIPDVIFPAAVLSNFALQLHGSLSPIRAAEQAGVLVGDLHVRGISV